MHTAVERAHLKQYSEDLETSVASRAVNHTHVDSLQNQPLPQINFEITTAIIVNALSTHRKHGENTCTVMNNYCHVYNTRAHQ